MVELLSLRVRSISTFSLTNSPRFSHVMITKVLRFCIKTSLGLASILCSNYYKFVFYQFEADQVFQLELNYDFPCVVSLDLYEMMLTGFSGEQFKQN